MGTVLRIIAGVLLGAGLAVPASADIYPSGLSRTRDTRMVRRPATAAVATVDRIVGTNGRIPNAAITSSVLANKREYQGRMPFLMGGDVSEFALAFDNWGLNPSPVDNSSTDTISELWIAVEGGAARRMTFGGSTSLVMAGNAARQLSDRLRPGDFGFSGEIPRGTKFWVCIRGVIGVGGNL